MVRIILTVTAAIVLGSVIGLALRATATGPGRHQQTATVASATVTSISPKEKPAPASKEGWNDASADKAEFHFDGDRVTIRFGKFRVDF
jgi:hypothetical protein